MSDSNGSIVDDNNKTVVGPDGKLYEEDENGELKQLDDDLGVDELETEVGAPGDHNVRRGLRPEKTSDPAGRGVEPKGHSATVVDGLMKVVEAIGEALKELF